DAGARRADELAREETVGAARRSREGAEENERHPFERNLPSHRELLRSLNRILGPSGSRSEANRNREPIRKGYPQWGQGVEVGVWVVGRAEGGGGVGRKRERRRGLASAGDPRGAGEGDREHGEEGNRVHEERPAEDRDVRGSPSDRDRSGRPSPPPSD